MKLLLPAISAALFATMFFSHEAIAAIQCYQCHGTSGPTDYRPLDATQRNISTGGFKGNHRTHMGIGATPASCSPCHGAASATYLTTHRDGSINMSVNINTSPATGTYSKGASFVQSGNPALGTCSNVNCHFEATTPTWGNAAFTSPNDCNKCHGAPPFSIDPGSHTKHDVYYPGAANCVKCHSDHTSEANKFAHATSAGKRNLNISFAAAPNNGSGAYSGPLNDYLPSQSNVFGSCTSTYCHSPGNKASSLDAANGGAPTWGGGSLTCKGCHKADSASGDALISGSHAAHLGVGNLGMGAILACTKCHGATTNSSMAITDTGKHVDKLVTIAFNNSSSATNGRYNNIIATPGLPMTMAPGTGPFTCTNVYCHSKGQGDGGTPLAPGDYTSPTWGVPASGKCGTCHGIYAQHDVGLNIGIATPLTSGSHAKHLNFMTGFNNAKRCAACHISTRTGFSPTSCNSVVCHDGTLAQKHPNNAVNVSIPEYYGTTATYNGTTKPGDGYSNCSNVSCHYNSTTPAWGTATNINCFGCHTLAVLGGSHSKHISSSLIPTMYNYTANRSTTAEYDFGCSNCHPVATTNHMNGTVNITLRNNESGVGAIRTKNNTTGAGIGAGITGTTKTNIVCSAAYCHSNGNAAELVYAVTPNWYGGTFLNSDRCANCHGNAPNSTIAGSKSHYNNKFLGYTSNAGGHQIGIHAMKIYSSPGGLAKAGTVGSSSHGNAGTSTTISCNICHYATVTIARNDNNGVCKTCHVSGNTVGALFGNQLTTVNKSKHVNGIADIAFKPISTLSKAQMRTGSFNQSLYSSVWKRNVGYKANGAYDSAKGALNTATMWNSSTKTCSNIACHNGQSVKWSDNNGTTGCVSCHTAL